MRRRSSNDGEADKNQVCNSCSVAAIDDSDKCDAIKGYRKLFLLILLFIALVIFRCFVFDIVSVAGHSMDDSFLQGDILVVRKFNTAEIEKYDVVIANVENQNIIKRVIGEPGDTIQISGGMVFVNGKTVEEKFSFYTDYTGVAGEPYTLGQNEYFLMGDNRSESYDSRDFGSVNHSQISGIAVVRIFPIWRMKII